MTPDRVASFETATIDSRISGGVGYSTHRNL